MLLDMKNSKMKLLSQKGTKNLFPDLNQIQQNDSKMCPRPTFHHQVYTYKTLQGEDQQFVRDSKFSIHHKKYLFFPPMRWCSLRIFRTQGSNLQNEKKIKGVQMFCYFRAHSCSMIQGQREVRRPTCQADWSIVLKLKMENCSCCFLN